MRGNRVWRVFFCNAMVAKCEVHYSRMHLSTKHGDFRGAPDELVSWAGAASFHRIRDLYTEGSYGKTKLFTGILSFVCTLKTRTVTLVTYSLTYTDLVCKIPRPNNSFKCRLSLSNSKPTVLGFFPPQMSTPRETWRNFYESLYVILCVTFRECFDLPHRTK